jgi:hypothetical protein
MLAFGNFDSSDWRGMGSVVALGHVNANVGVLIDSFHYRLAILMEVPANCKEKDLD